MISDSWEKLIVCVVYPWDNVLAGQFSSGQLCRQKITWKKIFLGSNFRGDIVRGQLSLGWLSGSDHPGCNCRGGEAIFLGVIVRGAIIRGPVFLDGNYPRGTVVWGAIMWGATVRKAIIRGTNFLGDTCPDTISNITDMGKISIICNTSDITGIINTAQKMKFSIENFFSKYDQIYRPADLVTFTQEILNGKFHFLYGAVLMTLPILKTLLIFRRKFSNVGKTSYINNVSNVVKLSDIWVLKWIREL